MRNNKKRQQGAPFDLFGEIPVTWPEIFAWCAAVADLPADSPRLERYVRVYDVAGKIRRAKLAGDLEQLLEIASGFRKAPTRLQAALSTPQPGLDLRRPLRRF